METFTVELYGNNRVCSATRIERGHGTTTVSIRDSPVYSVNDAAAIEGEDVTFTISRVGDTSAASTVYYRLKNGSALALTDYVRTTV